MERRLPVYLLLDTSGSMKGEPIESVKVGLESMISSLRTDPYALESVRVSIITFDREVRRLMPLTPLEDMQIPKITVPESAPTHTGEALRFLCECVDSDVQPNTPDRKGDWRPILFLLTDGKPSDTKLYNDMCAEVKKRKFTSIVACAAGMRAQRDPLKLLTNQVFSLQTMDGSEFKQFFKWVSASVCIGSQSIGADGGIVLPPPPPEINLVI